jgi:glycosyltransferase involved in cell wall biosynthesis
MAEAPDVSVVIPTRDRWSLLSRTLASALAQEDVRVEAIVVDDGSATGQPEDLRCDERVRVLEHERPLGVAHARNTGIRAAAGEWVALLDDDDLWSPDKLREQLRSARRSGADWAYSAVVLVDGELRGLEALPAPDPERVLDRLIAHPTSAIPAGASNVCVRTEVVRGLGAFDERLFHLADWDLWLRLAERGAPAACAEQHVAYVRHAGSMLLHIPEQVLDEAEYLFDKHAALAERRSARFDALGFERWVASGHRRAGRRRKAAAIYVRGAVRHRRPANLLRAVGALIGESVWRRASPYRYEQGTSSPGWLSAYAEARQ